MKVTPKTLSRQHIKIILDVISNLDKPTRHRVYNELKNKLAITQYSAYKIFSILRDRGLIVYEPYKPILIFRKIYPLSRDFEISLDEVMKLPNKVKKSWIEHLVLTREGDSIRWVYLKKRKDGLDPPIFYIKPDGIYEKEWENKHLARGQRENMAFSVYKIMLRNKCLKYKPLNKII